MKLFLDTSSLIKLYFREDGTEELDSILETGQVEAIFLSDLAKVEFDSAIWKKIRSKDLLPKDGLILMEGFHSDHVRYRFVTISERVISEAMNMLMKYGTEGLRTLDALQLASAMTIKDQVDMAKTSDNLLQLFMEKEGFKCR